MKYYIIAGEASGNLHAASLMRALFACDRACEVRFWGGEAMAAAGGTQVRDYRSTDVMGMMEVLAKVPRILRHLAFCKRDLRAWKPDVVILVDYPGFNMKVARFARRKGFHVVWYIAPKLWAHQPQRVDALKRDVEVLYCIFPFELDWFRQHGVEPRYFGNPLVGQVQQTRFRRMGEGPIIALLAGSREMEIKYLLPRFARLEQLLDADPRLADYRLVLAAAPSLMPEQYRKYMPRTSRIELVWDHTYDILHQAEAALVCSGTASLEAALLGTPQVVCYALHPLTYAVARRSVHVPFISLVNLTLGRVAVPELIQEEATPERMFSELEHLLRDESGRAQMAADYRELKEMLGDGKASARTAKDLYETFARI
jgi:lipid-A-disaccharide synthase